MELEVIGGFVPNETIDYDNIIMSKPFPQQGIILNNGNPFERCHGILADLSYQNIIFPQGMGQCEWVISDAEREWLDEVMPLNYDKLFGIRINESIKRR